MEKFSEPWNLSEGLCGVFGFSKPFGIIAATEEVETSHDFQS